MTRNKIEQIIQQGEGYFIEFKRNFDNDLKKEIIDKVKIAP